MAVKTGDELKITFKNLLITIRLINILLSSPKYNIPKLSSILGENERNIYRFIKVLKKAGFPVKKNSKHRYYIDISTSLLKSEKADNILLPLHQIPLLRHKQTIILLQWAIDNQIQVNLIDYDSPQDGIIAKRRIEPLYIGEQYKRLVAYDFYEKKQRQFRIQRIGDIEHLSLSFEEKREAEGIDVFGLSGKVWMPIHLKLSRRAYRLMIEEFPFSERFITGGLDEYDFKGKVLSWFGIGRFYLGLPGEMSIEKGEDFKAFLKKRMACFSL